MISDFLAMETILEIVFIILRFQRAILRKIGRFLSQLITSGNQGSKYISQEAMKRELTIILIYRNIMANLIH